MRGHIRRRGKASFEYIVDIGTASAQRCQGCSRRFWVERKPKESCPKCGGELCETEERRRAIKGGYATRKECQAALHKVPDGSRGAHLRCADAHHRQGLPAGRVAAGHQGHAATDHLRQLHDARPAAHHPPSGRPATAEAQRRLRSMPSTPICWTRGASAARAVSQPPRYAACTPFCTAPVAMPCVGAD